MLIEEIGFVEILQVDDFVSHHHQIPYGPVECGDETARALSLDLRLFHGGAVREAFVEAVE